MNFQQIFHCQRFCKHTAKYEKSEIREVRRSWSVNHALQVLGKMLRCYHNIKCMMILFGEKPESRARAVITTSHGFFHATLFNGFCELLCGVNWRISVKCVFWLEFMAVLGFVSIEVKVWGFMAEDWIERFCQLIVGSSCKRSWIEEKLLLLFDLS